MQRAGLAAAAVALCAAVTSCASLPTSGTIPVKALQGTGVQGQAGLQVDPAPPAPSMRPRDIVQGFLAASASFADDHAVARMYLTSHFAKTWRPGWSATIVDSQAMKEIPFQGKPTLGGPPTTVVLSRGRFSTLQTAGEGQAGSVVVAPASTVFKFTLVQNAGQWRIASIYENNRTSPSPSLLLLTKLDFERDYVARNIYYFPAGSSQDMLVPDPVFIPQTGLLSEVRGLVSALIQPRCRSGKGSSSDTCPTNPPDSSWLWGAAVTAFPRGVRIVKPVQVVGGVTAVVDLGHTASGTSAHQRQRMAAQLFWSLTESPYGAQAGGQIRSVVLKFGNQQVTASPRDGWVPDGQTSPLYYQVPGAPGERTQVKELQTGKSQPLAQLLPTQVGNLSLTAMAVSPAVPGSSASPAPPTVLAGCIGKTLYLIPEDRAWDMVTRRLPGRCTSLSWDRHGGLWIAATSGVYVMPGAGGSTPPKSAVVQVQTPWLPQNAQPVSTLSVAPDGVRVAMIVPSGKTSKIMIAAISKNSLGTYTYIGQTAKMLRVGSELADPVALSWVDPDHLMVLDQVRPGRNEIYEVPLNGGASTEITTPPGAISLAAASPAPGRPPRVVIGIKTAGVFKIEYLHGSLINPDWQPLGNGTTTGKTPVFPG